jgi:hypothetical protein
VTEILYPGITYSRQVRRDPRPLVIHAVTVELKTPGVELLVTPGEAQAELPLEARTTSQFLEEFGVQVAINGDGFTPWRSFNLLDYYPRTGDLVEPIGFAASQGTIYSQDTDSEPTLYLSRTNAARIGSPAGRVYNAISGNLLLVKDGKPAAGLEASIPPELQTENRHSEKRPKREKPEEEQTPGPQAGEPDLPQPRTAAGLDKSGRRLFLVVVDGRQPNYSQGATLAELAEILVALGAHTALNLDGGGSSVMVVEGSGGKARVLNSPIDRGLPGLERAVGNHLGVFAGQPSSAILKSAGAGD